MHVLTALNAIRDPHIVQMLISVSEGASAWTIASITACAALVLALREQHRLALGLLTAILSSTVMLIGLKALIARPRPPAPFFAYHETWWSFPSGHATLAMTLYGFLALLICRSGASKPLRLIGIACTTAIILVIGFSRLYLGVHYPSDVIAGYTVGAFAIWLGMRAVQYFETS